MLDDINVCQSSDISSICFLSFFGKTLNRSVCRRPSPVKCEVSKKTDFPIFAVNLYLFALGQVFSTQKDWSLEREEMIYDPICMKLVQHLAPIWPYLVWYKSEISAIFGFGLPIFGAPAVIISLLLAIPSCCSEVSPQLIRTIRLTENSIPISSTQSKLNLI